MVRRFTRRLTGVMVACVAAAGLTGVAQAADITGAGATFPYPIYAKWAEAYKAKTNIGLNYQSIGSGGGQDRRFRRVGHAAQGQGPERDRADPVPYRHGRRGPGLPSAGHRGRQDQVLRSAAGRHLYGQGQEVERPGDQEAERGRQASQPGDHGRPSFGRFRHDLHLHQLSEQGQPGVEGQGRQLDRGSVADGHRRQG